MYGFGLSPSQSNSNQWKKWLKMITRGGAIMDLKKAAIIPHNGSKVIHSKGFDLTQEEIAMLQQYFTPCEPAETIRANGCTFCLKSACAEQVIAFNGGRYLIISKVHATTVVAVCECRDKITAAATWLLRIASHIG